MRSKDFEWSVLFGTPLVLSFNFRSFNINQCSTAIWIWKILFPAWGGNFWDMGYWPSLSCFSQFEATCDEILFILNYFEKPAIPLLVHSRIGQGSHAKSKRTNKMRRKFIETSEFYFEVGAGSNYSYSPPDQGDSTEVSVGGILSDPPPPQLLSRSHSRGNGQYSVPGTKAVNIKIVEIRE